MKRRETDTTERKGQLELLLKEELERELRLVQLMRDVIDRILEGGNNRWQ